MRIALILVSILCAFSVIANCGIGYYGFTLYQKNQAIDIKLRSVNTQVEEKSSQIKTLNDTVSSTKTELLNANNRVQTQTKEIADLSKAKDRLDSLMCMKQINRFTLFGKVTRDQVSRAIQTFYEDEYNTVINDVKYSGELYSNKKDFQMDFYFTSKNDKKDYKDSITVTYKLFTDDKFYKADNDSVAIVMSTNCIYYLATP
jgi:hypothetical protein